MVSVDGVEGRKWACNFEEEMKEFRGRAVYKGEGTEISVGNR